MFKWRIFTELAQGRLQTVMSAGQNSLKFMKPDKEEATERVFWNV